MSFSNFQKKTGLALIMRINNSTNRFLLLRLSLGLLFLLGCKTTSERREYSMRNPELPQKTSISRKMELPPNHPTILETQESEQNTKDISWTLPKGWTEKAGSGMRLATIIPNTNHQTEISVVLLGGTAGGLLPNVIRWAEQLGIEFSQKQAQDFLQQQIELKIPDQGPAFLVDYSSLQTKDNNSMLVAMITRNQKTIFIKMAGQKSTIKIHRQNFTALCQSIRFNTTAKSQGN